MPGSLRCLLAKTDGAAPVVADLTPGVLTRLAVGVAVVFENAVGAAVQLRIALADNVAQALEAVLLPQALELKVVVEHQRRPGKMTGPTRACGRQAYDEVSAAAEAERERGVVRVRTDLRVPFEVLLVDLMQVPQLLPEQSLEGGAAAYLGLEKARHIAVKFARQAVLLAPELQQVQGFSLSATGTTE